MSIACTPVTDTALYELRFQSLFHSGRACSFPCDADGRVQREALSERARESLAHVEAAVGIDFATPAVQRRDAH
jgi:hypothetical protein